MTYSNHLSLPVNGLAIERETYSIFIRHLPNTASWVSAALRVNRKREQVAGMVKDPMTGMILRWAPFLSR
jgi:hypothetical protein